MITGAFLVLTVCWGIFFSFHLLPENYYLFLTYLCAPIPLWIVKLTLFCFINIPLILIIYGSILYLFGFRNQKKFIITSGVIWLVSCFVMTFLSIYYITNNANNYETRVTTELSPARKKNQPLYIQFRNLCSLSGQTNTYFRLDRYLYYCSDSTGSHTLYLQPTIEFGKTEHTTPLLVLEKEARGFSSIAGIRHRENIRYNYLWHNDTLFLDSYFTLDKPIIRDNQLNITILIPENYQIHLQDAIWQQIRTYNFADSYGIKQERPARANLVIQDNKFTLISE